MKFKCVALPGVRWPGVKYSGPKLVVPNMAMSLQEILERFTRGESLEIGRDATFDDEGDDDLEKVAHMDPVDKQEFIDGLKQTRKDYEKQEKKRAAEEKKRLDTLAVEKLAADKLAAEKAK